MHNINKIWITSLWEEYKKNLNEAQIIIDALKNIGINPILDHLAFIDLPGNHSGIPFLARLFEKLDFITRGEGYLKEKQNSFQWMAEKEANAKPAKKVLPQLVIADFKKEDLSSHICQIIDRYADYIKPIDYNQVTNWVEEINLGSELCCKAFLNWITSYFNGREWPLPTYQEYCSVCRHNELLAWVLIFGRKPNHFTFSIHHMNNFIDLNAFNEFVSALGIPLNPKGGVIKGSPVTGIEQSSILAPEKKIVLEGGTISIPSFFIEFIWRHPIIKQTPYFWKDYHTNFIGQQANQVVESIYKS